MRWIRSVAAIVAGFGFMASTARIGTIVGTALFVPGGLQAVRAGAPPVMTPAYLAWELVAAGIGAVLGGWLAARIAVYAPYAHAALLAAVVAIVSLGSAAGGAPNLQPAWYPSIVGVVGVVGVLLGGKLRAAAASAGPHVVA